MKADEPARDARRTAAAYRLLRLDRAERALDYLFRSMPVGHRVLKGLLMATQASTASLIAYGIGLLLHTQQAFWAAITAIAVTQLSYTDTRGSSRDQCIGAALGAVAGLFGIWLDVGQIVSFVVAVFVVIVACWILNAGASARLGAITATIVLLVPSTGPAWQFAFIRVGEVALGTVCALSVSWAMARIQALFIHEHTREDDA
ncbi:fusaric acid resistance family protein [Luteibacter rhizovicinus]|uniref:Fusaric acid resistance family protein n=1 Tax=Luteibacter rhizovicinus TaxID=242606 RepID=A0A4V6P464_9GAMM|nr:FUSC family protein [Luteibacter rhizovicinus]TCV96079.1 fusaric acid resistance family protein [Luteibacter rhizovicinus]